jgi:opacity protein-like surface antigen
LSIRLDNRMYGGQVGARLEQQLLPSVTLGLQAAFGLYANDVERRRTFVEEAISTTLLNDKISGTKMSWTTDLGATLSWQATSNLSIDLGYSALLLGNVALTPSHFERAATINDGSLRANSDVWVHGVRLGTTLRY